MAPIIIFVDAFFFLFISLYFVPEGLVGHLAGVVRLSLLVTGSRSGHHMLSRYIYLLQYRKKKLLIL